MLDKKVVKFTRDGLVEKDLLTGETKMLVQSEFGREKRFRTRKEESVYQNRHGQSSNSSHPLVRPARRAGKPAESETEKAVHEKMPDGRLPPEQHETVFPARGIHSYRPQHNGSRDSLPSGCAAENQNGKAAESQVQAGDRQAADTEERRGYPGRAGRQKPNFSAGQRIFHSAQIHAEDKLKGSDEIGLRVAGQGFRTARHFKSGAQSLWSKNIRSGSGRRLLRETEIGTEKNLKESDEIGLKTAGKEFQAARCVQTGAGQVRKRIKFGKKGKPRSLLKNPFILKIVLTIAAVILLIVLMTQAAGSILGSIIGSTTEHPELTAYVQQLDENFLEKLDSVKASYEKKKYQVSVEGDESVAADPNALAILVTKDWTDIDLTPENKAKMEQDYAVLNSYSVSCHDETVNDGKSKKVVHYAKIIVHTCTAEEKIDSFGFTQAEKSHVLEMLDDLRQIAEGTGISGGGSVSGSVLAYQSLVSRNCAKYGIPQYTDLALAVMQQESGGTGGDPMQCSEGPCNTRFPHAPNSITDPAYSIQCGVQELAGCLRAAKCKSPGDTPGISLALQGYNFGNGYITWALKRGGYTQADAAEFSQMEAKKTGRSGYGDVDYVSHVLRYYHEMQSAENGNFIWPLPGHTCISSGYGTRTDPITGKAGSFHPGIDIPAPTGTPVLASADGKVILARAYGGYGSCVILQHADGIQTLYGHNSALLVKKGDTVKQGQAIAKVGQTGRATGPHCHFEFRINGTHVNPAPYLKGMVKK